MSDRDGEDETDLRRAFAALRREDAELVPPFEAVRASSGRRHASSWMVLAVASLGVAVVATLLVWRPTPEPPMVSMEQWTAPTDFLLNTPGWEMLGTVPRMGTRSLPPVPDRDLESHRTRSARP